jgi:alkylated DNA repair dioxygenase AlkB
MARERFCVAVYVSRWSARHLFLPEPTPWRTLVRARRYDSEMGFAVQTSLLWDEPLAADLHSVVASKSGLITHAAEAGELGNRRGQGMLANYENGESVEFASLCGVERILLSDGAWVEIRRAWLRGGFALLEGLLSSPEWVSERRRMYDRVVDTPRLLRFYRTGEQVPWVELAQARAALSKHYFDELGEEFTSTGMCLYRDGRDSVAWHGDTIGRGATEDTIVAIVSLGASRPFALRPRAGGGPSMRFTLDHGDLIVMGGSCQRTWEHALPKTAKNVGPRISVQFRPAGVS